MIDGSSEDARCTTRYIPAVTSEALTDDGMSRQETRFRALNFLCAHIISYDLFSYVY